MEEMKLGEYKRHFTEEMIDGAVLAECDEDVLCYELGITNRSHRAKLMKVIKGASSVKWMTD